MRNLGIIIILLFLALLTGCPPCPPPSKPLPLPPPISLGDQLDQLNARSTALANLKGHGKVTVSYFDLQGKKHTHDVDGTLLLRQHPDDPANPADMLLVGRVVGQDAFEAGMNRVNYWMAVRLDVKRAYVGTVANMADVPVSAMPLRADRVAELAALTPLHDGPRQRIDMLVSDDDGTNEIYVIQTTPDGDSHIERVLTVNRRSGQVVQVRLYNPDGTLLAKADLSDYQPAKIAEDVQVAAPVAFPMHITLEYPDRDINRTAKVTLDFHDLTIVPPISDKVFAMPNFSDEGLEVVDLGKGD